MKTLPAKVPPPSKAHSLSPASPSPEGPTVFGPSGLEPSLALSEAPGAAHRGNQGNQGNQGKGLLVIALFKLLKGVLLLGVACGALALVHRDLEEMGQWIVDAFQMNPESRQVEVFLEKWGLLNAHRLSQISVLSGVYSGVLLTEGVGLLYRKRWAEYLTVGVTCSLIPWEVYEVWMKLTPLRLGVLTVNVLVVWYLVRMVRRRQGKDVGLRGLGGV